MCACVVEQGVVTSMDSSSGLPIYKTKKTNKTNKTNEVGEGQATMLPSTVSLGHARLGPSPCVCVGTHQRPPPSTVGWEGYPWSEDDNVYYVDAPASMEDFATPRESIGVKMKREWYDGSLASMVAINKEDCSICLLPMITGQPDDGEPAGQGGNDWAVVCKKKHAFHNFCIQRWADQAQPPVKGTCPLCKFPLLLGDKAPKQPTKPPFNDTLKAIKEADELEEAEELKRTEEAEEANRAEEAEELERTEELKRGEDTLEKETLLTDIRHARHR